MPQPETFIQHLRDFGYHPRSDKHSNALAAAIVEDLITLCPAVSEHARAGRLVYALNFDIRFKTATWNSDLVIGTPAVAADTKGAPIVRAAPSTVRIAIEIKSVMTEHRKAVKNRKRDFEAHHEHVHNYNERAIAGGVMILNASPSFNSPLRRELTIHGRGERPLINRLIEHCVSEMRNVTESGGGVSYGLDAKTLMVVSMDNVNLASAMYVDAPPAPQPGDPLHYDSFIQKLCDQYASRFGAM